MKVLALFLFAAFAIANSQVQIFTLPPEVAYVNALKVISITDFGTYKLTEHGNFTYLPATKESPFRTFWSSIDSKIGAKTETWGNYSQIDGKVILNAPNLIFQWVYSDFLVAYDRCYPTIIGNNDLVCQDWQKKGDGVWTQQVLVDIIRLFLIFQCTQVYEGEKDTFINKALVGKNGNLKYVRFFTSLTDFYFLDSYSC